MTGSPAPRGWSRSLWYCLLIGLLQGLLFQVAFSTGWVTEKGLGIALYAAIVVIGGNLQLLGAAVLQRGTLWLVAGLVLLIGAISLWAQAYTDEEGLWYYWLACVPALAYIGTVFTLAWPAGHGLRLRYQDLARHAWDTPLIVLVALFTMLLFWALLYYCSLQLVRLGVSYTTVQICMRPVEDIGCFLAFAFGLHMAQRNVRLIGLLRGLALNLCRLLLPLVASAVVLLTLLLPFIGVQALWASAQATLLLLALVGVELLLVNGVLGHERPWAAGCAPLRRLVEASLLCLPVLVGLAAWACGLRIEQYGVTPLRLLALLLVALMLLHGLAAAWAVWGAGSTWLGRLRASNPGLALFAGLALVLFFSPLNDPFALSARSQVARVLDGRLAIADFDAGDLYWRLGKPGREAFDVLQVRLEGGELQGLPGRDLLRAKLAEVTAYRERAENR